MPPRHVLVTGQPGCGKTTLITRLARSAASQGLRLSGFYTEEVLDDSSKSRIGFDVVTMDGQRGVLARKGESRSQYKTGQYSVDVASFEKLALPSMRPSTEVDLYVIDEIGRMELHSESFKKAASALLESGIPIFGSIAAGRYGRSVPFCEDIKEHPDVHVVHLKPSNRAEAAEECRTLLCAQLGIQLA